MAQNLKSVKKVLPVTILVFLFIIISTNKVQAQSPCMATVPSYTINLTGNPAGVWSSPKLVNHCKNNVTCTEEEHQQNRRTEFKAIKIQIYSKK